MSEDCGINGPDECRFPCAEEPRDDRYRDSLLSFEQSPGMSSDDQYLGHKRVYVRDVLVLVHGRNPGKRESRSRVIRLLAPSASASIPPKSNYRDLYWNVR
jgi:hypothetical protein